MAEISLSPYRLRHSPAVNTTACPELRKRSNKSPTRSSSSPPSVPAAAFTAAGVFSFLFFNAPALAGVFFLCPLRDFFFAGSGFAASVSFSFPLVVGRSGFASDVVTSPLFLRLGGIPSVFTLSLRLVLLPSSSSSSSSHVRVVKHSFVVQQMRQMRFEIFKKKRMNQIKSNSQRLAACVVQTQQKRVRNTTETQRSSRKHVRPSVLQSRPSRRVSFSRLSH